MKAGIRDELSQKYIEALEQGISDGEMVEYLSDNSNATIDEILEYVAEVNS